MMNSFKAGMFSSVGSRGRGGGSGASVLTLHPQGAASDSDPSTFLICSSGGKGNVGLMTPSSERHLLLKNRDLSSVATCKICFDSCPLMDTVTGIAPMTVSLLPSATRRNIIGFN